ncbi:hypothetical protein SELMODRAFT_412569 [Selaginella moellendorffii]|uniref:Uncharacterized protein n=1 Tax=Selaginella moellendorffii TaxID=88036 RepID=D8RLW9_SELML|nr:hypothetical protein SELMODRAFT_412569 [Selaginella moellendorffii]
MAREPLPLLLIHNPNMRHYVNTTRMSHDLCDVIDHLNIDAKNPCVIMSQDMSQDFLSTGSKKEKFKFYFKATLLEKVSKLPDMNTKTIQVCDDFLQKDKKSSEVLEQDLVKIEEKLLHAEQMDELGKEVRTLQKRLVWAIIHEINKKLKDIQVLDPSPCILLTKRACPFATYATWWSGLVLLRKSRGFWFFNRWKWHPLRLPFATEIATLVDHEQSFRVVFRLRRFFQTAVLSSWKSEWLVTEHNQNEDIKSWDFTKFLTSSSAVCGNIIHSIWIREKGEATKLSHRQWQARFTPPRQARE